jgi:ATP-dependent Clp protease ATP-binding subunit ClpA
MDRVITQHIKPLLTREILFGSLKEGGEATIDTQDSQFSITSVSRK